MLAATFFLITATTFASLGIVLPAMIEAFDWSWTTAGLGFTCLALLTGVFSPIAATSLQILGPRGNYAIGGAIMVAGYLLMAATNGVATYLAAASLLGAGFALLANVPGTYIVGSAAPERWRNISIGAYLAAGGAGGVFGPLIANAYLEGGDDWRAYWRACALLVGLCSIAIVAAIRRSNAVGVDADKAALHAADRESAPIPPRAAMRTPAFAIIAIALTVAYFCGVTVSTWSVAHLEQKGLAASAAVAMLSLYSAANALSRAAGGFAAKTVSPKTLLVLALIGNVVGMSALAFASTLPLAIVFAIFDGFAFGMALFATTALLIDYFGLRNSPALIGAVNLAATSAMIGPTIAGQSADRLGSFAPIFMIYAILALLAAVAVARMRAPQLQAMNDAERTAGLAT